MKNEMNGFVLLSGGGMSSWIWRDLIPLLRLPAMTLDYRLPINTFETRTRSSIQDCIEHIIDQIEKNEMKKIIVVGHSGAGILAANLAKQIPQRIHHMVFLCGNIPPNHRSAIDSLPFLLKILNRIAIRSQVRRQYTPARKMEKILRSKFCNTCSEHIIQYILQQNLLSEPLCMAFEKNNWDNFPKIEKTYILLTKDKTLSVKGQRKMMDNLSIKNSFEIESGHMVMLSHPNELSEILNRISESIDS